MARVWMAFQTIAGAYPTLVDLSTQVIKAGLLQSSAHTATTGSGTGTGAGAGAGAGAGVGSSRPPETADRAALVAEAQSTDGTWTLVLTCCVGIIGYLIALSTERQIEGLSAQAEATQQQQSSSRGSQPTRSCAVGSMRVSDRWCLASLLVDALARGVERDASGGLHRCAFTSNFRLLVVVV
jgi:hypothetical protein